VSATCVDRDLLGCEVRISFDENGSESYRLVHPNWPDLECDATSDSSCEVFVSWLAPRDDQYRLRAVVGTRVSGDSNRFAIAGLSPLD